MKEQIVKYFNIVLTEKFLEKYNKTLFKKVKEEVKEIQKIFGELLVDYVFLYGYVDKVEYLKIYVDVKDNVSIKELFEVRKKIISKSFEESRKILSKYLEENDKKIYELLREVWRKI